MPKCTNYTFHPFYTITRLAYFNTYSIFSSSCQRFLTTKIKRTSHQSSTLRRLGDKVVRVKAFEMAPLYDKEAAFQREMAPFLYKETSFQVLSSAPFTLFHQHLTFLSPITPTTFTIFSQPLLPHTPCRRHI